MSIKKLVAVFVVSLHLAVLAKPAVAEGSYFSVQYAVTRFEVNASDSSTEWNPDNLIMSSGFELNDNFAIEGRYGFSVREGTTDGVPTEIYMSGVYFKAAVPLNAMLPYAMLGYTSTEALSEFDGYTDSVSEAGASYGLGLDIVLSEKIDLSLEYMNYYSGRVRGIDFDITTTGLGLKFKL